MKISLLERGAVQFGGKVPFYQTSRRHMPDARDLRRIVLTFQSVFFRWQTLTEIKNININRIPSMQTGVITCERRDRMADKAQHMRAHVL
jgi:hypothetical protein